MFATVSAVADLTHPVAVNGKNARRSRTCSRRRPEREAVEDVLAKTAVVEAGEVSTEV